MEEAKYPVESKSKRQCRLAKSAGAVTSKDKTRVNCSNCKLTTLAYHRRILFTDFFSQSPDWISSPSRYFDFWILYHLSNRKIIYHKLFQMGFWLYV
ncbi:MAG: hypothetical protein ACLVBP_14650 [Ruminococcus sp.]